MNRKGQTTESFILICFIASIIIIGLYYAPDKVQLNYTGGWTQRLDRIETLLNKHTEIYNSFVKMPTYTLCPVCARRNSEQ